MLAVHNSWKGFLLIFNEDPTYAEWLKQNKCWAHHWKFNKLVKKKKIKNKEGSEQIKGECTPTTLPELSTQTKYSPPILVLYFLKSDLEIHDAI